MAGPLALLLLAAPAWAGKTVEVPIDIGVGPAAHLISGPMFEDQPVHTGLVFSAEAVLDKKTIRKFKKRIPSQYREMALSMEEIRISHPLIPDTIWISPAAGDRTTGMYGLSLRPVSLGITPMRDPVRLAVGAGVRLSYAYIHSTTLPSPTHFLRPGLDLGAELELPLSDTFLVSFGWDSQLYIPQTVGGPIFEVGPLDESIWHIGQAFFKVHVRFPYRVAL